MALDQLVLEQQRILHRRRQHGIDVAPRARSAAGPGDDRRRRRRGRSARGCAGSGPCRRRGPCRSRCVNRYTPGPVGSALDALRERSRAAARSSRADARPTRSRASSSSRMRSRSVGRPLELEVLRGLRSSRCAAPASSAGISCGGTPTSPFSSARRHRHVVLLPDRLAQARDPLHHGGRRDAVLLVVRRLPRPAPVGLVERRAGSSRSRGRRRGSPCRSRCARRGRSSGSASASSAGILPCPRRGSRRARLPGGRAPRAAG